MLGLGVALAVKGLRRTLGNAIIVVSLSPTATQGVGFIRRWPGREKPTTQKSLSVSNEK